MPVPFRFCKGKIFNHWLFGFKVGDHFFYRNIVVGNCRGFAITFNTAVLQLNDQRWLVRFSAFRNGKGIAKFEIVRPIGDFQAA